MKTVTIVQEYVAKYRVGFFEQLRDKASAHQINLRVAAGNPNKSAARRTDAAHLSDMIHLSQREFRVLGHRIVVRRTGEVFRTSDLIILEQARRNIDIYRLLAPRWIRRRKIALWGHGRDYAKQTGTIKRWLQLLLTRRADWFFGYTKAGVASAVAAGVAEGHTTVVQNTLDTSGLASDLQSIRSSERAQFIASNDLTARTAIYVGGLDTVKRVPFLVESARVAHNLDGDFRLIVAGDGEDRQLVQDVAAEEPWLTYVGTVDGRQKALLLSVAQILMVPGAIGLIALDSLVAGVPIATTLGTRHGPEYDYLRPNETVIVDDSGSAHGFAASIVAALADPNRLTRMSINCREDSLLYSLDAMVDNFLSGVMAALEPVTDQRS